MKRAMTISSILLPLLVVAGTNDTTFAEPLMPLYAGQVFTLHQRDATHPAGWTVLLQVMGSKVTLGSHDYFQIQVWNYGNSGQFEDEGYVRSTDQALYAYNPAGEDFVVFQKAPVGTRWSVPDDSDPYPYEVTEVAAIETVTVPYGTFAGAYKYRKYDCYDPANLSLGKSPDFYEWVVPGVGYVKEEDYWTDYPPAIEELTAVAVAPIYRFYNKLNGKHFYTIDPAEKNDVLAKWPWVFDFEGIKYYTLAQEGQAGTLPVYRFWSTVLGTHFYTIDEAEKNHLINDEPVKFFWTYEGPAFYAWPEGSQPADAKPVYRFWSDAIGSHVYTMSAAERDKLLVPPASYFWTYEGPAWYAYE
jgi:hypothetical protein